MNIKKKNLALIVIATFVFTALLSCGVFALVAKSVSFNMVMHLNPTVYFGLELQVDSNGDGDFSDSFTSNNVAFNESTVYTIFDNRITGFNDHEPWAIVNLNKIVLQNTDAVNNPFGDLGVNACFKIKVLNYTSATDLGVDENSAEMQALWLTLVPEDMSSMYAVPEYGVQNIAYGSFKEFMIYPQSITTDYFEIPFTVELKNKTVDHAINAITTEANPSGSGETVTITLDSPQNTITNGHDFIATFKTKFDTIKIGSVTLGGNEIAYTYTNQTKQIKIAGSNIFDLNSANSLQIHIEKVGYMLVDGLTLNRLLNDGVENPMWNGVGSHNQTFNLCTFDFYSQQKENVANYLTVGIGLGANVNKILIYKDAATPTIAYILSDYYIFANYSTYRMFAGFKTLDIINLYNIDTFYTTNFYAMFSWMHNNNLTLNNIENMDVQNATSLRQVFWQNTGIKSLNLSKWKTSKVQNLENIFCVTHCLTEIVGIESWDVSSVSDMRGIFYLSAISQELNLSGWKTQNATRMERMFSDCPNLVNVNLFGFNTEKVTSMAYMFHNSPKLGILTLSTFNTEKVTDMNHMFYNCAQLSKIYVSSKFITPNVTSSVNMFARCTSLSGGSNSTLAVVQADGIAAADSFTAKYARVDGGTAATRGYFTAA